MLTRFITWTAVLVLNCVTTFAGNLDFSLKSAAWPPAAVAAGETVFGYDLVPYEQWRTQPSHTALTVGQVGIQPLEVFEARGAAIVNKPISFFTKDYLISLETLQKFDPEDKYSVKIPGDTLYVKTTIDFPVTWSAMLLAAIAAGQAPKKATTYLDLYSYVVLYDGPAVASPGVQERFVQPLDIVGKSPDKIKFQGITYINEIGQFGSSATFFYQVDAKRTLIVNYFALALKSKDLNEGKTVQGVTFSVRKLLEGGIGTLNTKTGIGQGMPGFTKELFTHMLSAIETAPLTNP